MNQEPIDKLLEDLKNSDPEVREQASAQLWKIWFWQKGEAGLNRIEDSERLIAIGDFGAAEKILNKLIADLPDFVEAWNRRAVLYYLRQDFAAAIQDCNQAIALMPGHFGAWHGIGLCHAALGNYSEAIAALRQALEIQPYSIENQRLLLECTAQLG
jgi:tetratricopeptide (TPR) repeat protein